MTIDDDQERIVPIAAGAFWVKVVAMLQQNWALIENGDADAVIVHFISDTSGVFDALSFGTAAAAEAALRRNGFRPFASGDRLRAILSPPAPPYVTRPHPNGRIYSSGRFWATEPA